jgi:drug/metabolite transporter (DMT)-like permease
MSALALLFTMASTLAWAGFDVTRKYYVRRAEPAALVVLINASQLPGFVVWAALEDGWRLEPGYWVYGSVALVLNVAANLFFLWSVRLGALSETVPLLGLTPAFTALIGIVLLSEIPTALQWIAIAFVVLGALGLNAHSSDLLRPWRLLSTPVRERGGLYMTLVALLWSVTPVLDKLALEHASLGLHATFISGGTALLMVSALASSGRIGLLAPALRARPLLVGCAALSLVAFGCQLVAIQLMFVSLFEGLKRGLGMTLSVVSGRVFFAEPITLLRVLSVAVMTLGVALLV